MANKKQHLSYNHSKHHKVHHNPFPMFAVLGVLVVLVGGMSIYGIRTLKENNKPLDSDYVSSELAKASFLKTDAPKDVQKNSEKATPAGSTKPTASSGKKATPAPAKSPKTALTGNSNTSVAPTLPATVATPKSPSDSVRLFVSSVRSGDLTTANSLIGPVMAHDLASVAGSADQTMALETCRANYLCSALLDSFNPPASAKETITTSATKGASVAQVSFKLSQSSPLLATIVGDQNIDIFLIDYQGIWVIQNVYINGQPFKDAGL